MRRCLVVAALFCLWPATALTAQTVRLPLPVDGPAGALVFESAAPTAGVLTGVLIPSTGPLTSWAPVWSTLEADGSLKDEALGSWTGPRPERWLKVILPGSVVGGFRFLLRTGSGIETRQMQIFWQPWVNGEPGGAGTTSRVYGLAAAASDTVKIIELRLPQGAIPTGLYGQTSAGKVTQVSLLIRQPPAPPPQTSTVPATAALPSGPVLPNVPAVPVPLLKK